MPYEGFIHVGVIEQAELELHSEQPADGLVDPFFADPSLADQIHHHFRALFAAKLVAPAFHKEIASASGNQVLQELLQSIRSLLRIWVDRALTDEGHAAAALAEHRTIFKALESRDAASVTEAMISHMGTASRRLLAAYDAAR